MVTFKVVASGPSLSYQWQYKHEKSSSWSNWSGKTANTLTITVLQENAAYSYRCVVSNSYGSVTSDAATMTVTSTPTAKPSIKTQPQNTLVETSTVKFSVKASGGCLSYQWQSSSDGSTWTDCAKYGSSASFNASESNARLLYRCIVSNSLGSATSDAVCFIRIVTQPKDVSGEEGKTASFSVKAYGRSLKYHWQIQWDTEVPEWTNDACWPGENTNTLTVTAETYLHEKQFRCRITASNGYVVYSRAAMLTVPAG